MPEKGKICQVKIDLKKLFEPCFGFFLRGCVKETAIANAHLAIIAPFLAQIACCYSESRLPFVALASMIIFLAGIVEYYSRQPDDRCCRTDNKESKELKSQVRAIFWFLYYAYWISDIYLSMILYAAGKQHNVRTCKIWLIIQVHCFLLFLVLFGLHCFWMCGFNVILEAMFAVLSSYKVYTFWVVCSFVRRIQDTPPYMRGVIAQLTDADLEEFEKGNVHVPSLLRRTLSVPDQHPYNKSFEIPMENISDRSDWLLIGEGEFGSVYKAIYKRPNNTHMFVAIKTICSEPGFFKTQLSELKIRTEIGDHPNIVALIGACTKNIRDRQLELVVEFCPFGCLESFLQNRKGLFVKQTDSNGNIYTGFRNAVNNPSNNAIPVMSPFESVTTIDLVRWALQSAKGMAYLRQNQVIHGDLAARNILLSADKTAKINDFGLSTLCYSYKGYVRSKQKLIPWRWLAPESFSSRLIFSFESDIWAFGITLWEIFSMGDVPYAHLNEPDERFLAKLKNGKVLSRPPYAPVQLYEIMECCWRVNPKERITFKEIVTRLEDLLETMLVTTNAHWNCVNPDPEVAGDLTVPNHYLRTAFNGYAPFMPMLNLHPGNTGYSSVIPVMTPPGSQRGSLAW